MSKPDLRRLLDTDGLSPEQERKVRRLVSYQIKRSDGGGVFCLEYRIKGSTLGYSVFSSNLVQLKEKFHKQAMYRLIINYAKIYENCPLITEANKSMNSQYLYNILKRTVLNE